MDYVEKYRMRFGFYPRELLADQIYRTRANRASLKEKGIKLQGTSETWIACIILVLNLVKLAGVSIPCLVGKITDSFSAWFRETALNRFADDKCNQIILRPEIWQSRQVKPRWAA
jgi:hypothetical protein